MTISEEDNTTVNEVKQLPPLTQQQETPLYPFTPLSQQVCEVQKEFMEQSIPLFYYASNRDLSFYLLFGFLIIFYTIFIIPWFALSIASGCLFLFLTIFAFTILAFLIPKQIEIWSDSVRIRFFAGYSVNTMLEDIVGIDILGGCSFFFGLKFITSLSRGKRVAMYRRNNCFTSVLITPSNPSQFVTQVRYMMLLRTAELQSRNRENLI